MHLRSKTATLVFLLAAPLALALWACARPAVEAPAGCPPVQPANVTPGLLLLVLDGDPVAGTFYALDAGGQLTMLSSAVGVSTPGFVDAEWSPAAGRAVFVEGAERDAELYVADLAGNRYRLTDNDREDTSPSWSPDGRVIAFSARGNDGRLRPYIICADGSGLRPLTDIASITARAMRWSPDGRSIALAAQLTAPGDPNPLYVIRVDDRTVTHRLENNAANFVPRWSPDGRTIAYVSVQQLGPGPQLYLWELESGRQRLLTEQTDLFEFGWSPDGLALAFSQGAGGFNRTLSLVTLDGQVERRISADEIDDSVTRTDLWSPDGCLVYGAARYTDERATTQVLIQAVSPPSWLPDAPTVVFERAGIVAPIAWVYASDAPQPCATLR